MFLGVLAAPASAVSQLDAALHMDEKLFEDIESLESGTLCEPIKIRKAHFSTSSVITSYPILNDLLSIILRSPEDIPNIFDTMTLAFANDPLGNYIRNTPDAKPPPSRYLDRKVTEMNLASFLLTTAFFTIGHAVAFVNVYVLLRPILARLSNLILLRLQGTGAQDAHEAPKGGKSHCEISCGTHFWNLAEVEAVCRTEKSALPSFL
jgi:hypothetical protein